MQLLQQCAYFEIIFQKPSFCGLWLLTDLQEGLIQALLPDTR